GREVQSAAEVQPQVGASPQVDIAARLGRSGFAQLEVAVLGKDGDVASFLRGTAAGRADHRRGGAGAGFTQFDLAQQDQIVSLVVIQVDRQVGQVVGIVDVLPLGKELGLRPLDFLRLVLEVGAVPEAVDLV